MRKVESCQHSSKQFIQRGYERVGHVEHLEIEVAVKGQTDRLDQVVDHEERESSQWRCNERGLGTFDQGS